MRYCLLNKFVKNDATSPGYLSAEDVHQILQGKMTIPAEFYNVKILNDYYTAVKQLRVMSPYASELKFVKNNDGSETITCLIYNDKQSALTHHYNIDTNPPSQYLYFIAARDSLLAKFKITRHATKYIEVDNLISLDNFETLNILFNS